MATTSHPDEAVIALTPATPSPVYPPKPPNIKRHVQLYRYGKVGLLGKKAWKEGNVIIYDDSTFKIFKDAEGHKTSIKPIKLEDVVLDLAFGKAAAKYGPPPIIGDEHNFIAPGNFIAVPETKERNKIHWFAAKDEHGLNEIMHVIAETVAGKVRPPQMGKGPKGRYITQEEHEKWLAYWHAQQHAAEVPEENGAAEQKAASVTHAVMAKPVAIPVIHGSPKHGKKQPQVAFVEMPHTLEILRLEPDHNLRDQTNSDTVPVVRLVNGRRVKEDVVRKPPAPTYVNTALPPRPSPKPSPIPIHIQNQNQDHKNGRHVIGVDQYAPAPKYEISTYLIGDKPEKTTTNIAVTPGEHFTQHQEREEVVTDRQKTVINVGTSERSVNTVENSDDGVTYTSTKQSSYHRSTVTTSND